MAASALFALVSLGAVLVSILSHLERWLLGGSAARALGYVLFQSSATSKDGC